MDIVAHSRPAVVAYQHLLRLHLDERAASLIDTVPGFNDRQIWKWRQSHSEAMVAFPTPACGEEKGKPLPALGVSAQALNYLNADPIHAVAHYRFGVLEQMPRLERYAIHKLIVADRRRGGPNQLKARKDRARPSFSWRSFLRTVRTIWLKPTRTLSRVGRAGATASRQV